MIKYKYAEVASIEKQGMSFTNLEKAMLGRIASIDCSDVDCSHCQLHISDGPIGFRCLSAIIRQSNMSEELFYDD